MFPDNNQQQSTTDTNAPGAYPAPAPLVDSFASSSPASAPVTDPFLTPAPAAPPVTDTGSAPAPEPVQSTDEALNDFLSDSGGPSFLESKPADNTSTATDTSPVASNVDHRELSDMKQQAISQLQPLVGHLDQSAEDQFKTTMMLIQATDDHTLLKKAFETAQKIDDDKARAQALLDVINEINYFTQSHDNEQAS